eukprot:TRINITY_DN3932_c0_g1_i3.p1 TRINITY_DN3932_c0_g1~~TRINITY_DN3932_c0_g1_i3.p1  ORF type:complete len:152 (+),score=29.36 TRINITY_DN3932_c0_g1_i3:89-544(+)
MESQRPIDPMVDYIEIVAIGYQSMRLSREIFADLKKIPGLQASDWCQYDSQIRVLSEVIRHPRVLEYPPSAHYTMRFLKAYMEEIEDHNEELSEELMEQYFSVMTNAPKKPEEGGALLPPCYRTFRYMDQEQQLKLVTVKVQQQFNEVCDN